MDTTLFIEIVFAVLIVWLFIKFIVNPVLKIIFGIIIFLFLAYLLQRLFGFSIDKLLEPFGVSLGIDSWISKIEWIFSPLNSFVEKIKSFINYIWANVPKSN